MTVSKTMKTLIDTMKANTDLWSNLNVSVSQVLNDGREYMLVWVKEDKSENIELTAL